MHKEYKNLIKQENVFLLLVLFAMPEACHAGAFVDGFNNVIAFLQGPLVRSVGILSLIGAGYATFRLHKLPKDRFVDILVGISIILGAPALFDLIFK